MTKYKKYEVKRCIVNAVCKSISSWSDIEDQSSEQWLYARCVEGKYERARPWKDWKE